ncbi:hypothetical protein GF336_05655 [Candidatus Woesearchaeota archaeon]|nr:hypothetical protein [Candidatus Woesearchaeota archaeon]
MKNPICISTGVLYQITDDRNKMIKLIKRYNPQGIEMSFAYSKYLLDFKISKSNVRYLQKLNFNSIHAPWKDITYKRNRKTKQIMDKIIELYLLIKAKNVVFHRNTINNLRSIIDPDISPSLENDDWKGPWETIDKIRNVVDNYPSLRLTFDYAHALTVSSMSVPDYLRNYRDMLSEIHISFLGRDMTDHGFLFQHDLLHLRNISQLSKNTYAPFVLECVVPCPAKVDLLKKEVTYIKSAVLS